MKKVIIGLFCLLITGSNIVFAQSTGDNNPEGNDELIFVLKQKFPVNIVHQYYLLDSVLVDRVFSDSSSSKYSYQVLTHFSEKARNRRDDEGFLDVSVSIDSLEFNFMDYSKPLQTKYNTTWDEGYPPFNFKPFKQAMVSLGKEFELTYSNYDEVVNISGSRYENYLHELNNSKQRAITDTLERFIWIEGVDIDNMAYISDVSKDLLPSTGKIAKDSSWIAVMYNRVNGIHIIDTVEFKIKSYTTQQYVLEGKSIGMILDNKRVFPYRIDRLVTPESISGTGDYEIKMSPRGSIQSLTSVYDVYVKVPVREKLFYIEHINSNNSWILVNRFNY